MQKKKLRILVLNYEFPPLGGGASPVSYEISKGYAKLGHKVDVVTMHYKGLPFFESKDGMNIYRIPCWRSKKEICHPWEQLTYIWSAKNFLKKHLKTNTYDICHTHFIIPTGIVSLWLKKNYGIPYIITSHGSDVPRYNPDRFQLMHKFTKPLLRRILNNSNGAFAGSQYLANLGNKIGSRIQYRVIREGFDSRKFVPKRKKKLILSTGRLLERKGFQYLIKAVSEKDMGYEVHIAGDGPMMKELKQLAAESKTKIVFHGWLSNKSKKYKYLLESSAIYVLVSERENSSVSLLEAMSAGCAIITTNISGCPETIGDGGVITEAKNYKSLGKKIKQLIINNQRRTKLSFRARMRVKNCYKWKENIKRYLEVIYESKNNEI